MSIYQCLQMVDEVPTKLLDKNFHTLDSTAEWINTNNLPLLYLQEVYDYATNKMKFFDQKSKIENDEKTVGEYTKKDLVDVVNSYFQSHYKYKIDVILVEPDQPNFQRINGEYFYISKNTTVASLISVLTSMVNEHAIQINFMSYKKFFGCKIVF